MHTFINLMHKTSAALFIWCIWVHLAFYLTDIFKYSPQSAEAATITAVAMKHVGLS